MTSRVVATGSAIAIAGALHAAHNARHLRRPVVRSGVLPRVSVLVPARDEAAQLSGCLTSLTTQDSQDMQVEIIVLDDNSADDTARIAAGHGVRVINGAPLPDGWLGKPWACAQLARAADPASEVLVFIDADVRLEPPALRAAVALLVDAGLDLVSPHPRQIAVTPAERLVQPLLQWSFLTTLPLRLAERSARPSLTAANGQFLVVRRAAFEAAGGAVADAVLDDLTLARAVKRSGGRVAIADGSQLASCRMYSSWGELRDGYGKSLWAAFGSPAGAGAVVAGLGLGYVVPALAALRGSRLGLVGYAAGVASRVISARATGARVWPDAAAHPASIATFGYLTARSVRERRRGTLRWKGRAI